VTSNDGEAVASAEQSSMEHERMGEGKSGVGDGFLGDIRSSGKGAKPRGKATTGGHWHRALSTRRTRPSGTGAARGTGRPSRAVKRKRAADMRAQPIK
jgi:hypothetical protein